MVLHLKPPYDHVACDLKRQGTASASLPRVGPRTDVDERVLRLKRGRSSESKPAVAPRQFSHWPRRTSVVNRGMQGKVKLAEA